jgi:hypothetical protein
MMAVNTSVLTVPTETEIVVELTEELIRCHRLTPFRLGIYYDAKKEPARVTVHKVVKNGTMGEVEFNSEAAARKWCETALKEGYTVERLIGRGESLVDASVSRRRRMYEQKIKFNAMTPAQRQALDDEIPFMYEWR